MYKENETWSMYCAVKYDCKWRNKFFQTLTSASWSYVHPQCRKHHFENLNSIWNLSLVQFVFYWGTTSAADVKHILEKHGIALISVENVSFSFGQYVDPHKLTVVDIKIKSLVLKNASIFDESFYRSYNEKIHRKLTRIWWRVPRRCN